MTVYVDFAPNIVTAFQFQAVFDNQTYNLICPWNAFGQRYYVTCYNLNGNLVFNVPLIASPLFYDISLTAGYFTSTLVYRASSNQFEISS